MVPRYSVFIKCVLGGKRYMDLNVAGPLAPEKFVVGTGMLPF